MDCTLIVFSPTGGTEKAAALLCSGLGTQQRTLDLSDPAFQAAEVPAGEGAAVIAMPCFGGRVPALAAERLRKVRGNGVPCVLLCVYGNRAYEDALAEMEELARACGFTVAAAVAAVAEHSIMHQFAAGRPDRTDEKNLKEMGAKIAEKLGKTWEDGGFSIPGNRPYKKAGGVGLTPKAGPECVGCGLCAKQCPAGAIDPAHLKTADKDKCISCMRCVVRCPHGARGVNGAMVAAASLAMKKVCSVRKECELYL